MKLFDVDWRAVLTQLQQWDDLSLPGRRVLLDQLKLTGYAQASRFGIHLGEIVASGIPDYDPERHRLSVPDDQRELVKVLRAMGRHELFDDPGAPACVAYIQEHFAYPEIVAMVRTPYPSPHSLAQHVTRPTWTGELLRAQSVDGLAEWATTRGMRIDVGSIDRLQALQRIARELLEFPDGIPLRDLVAEPGAVHLGLRSLVLFAGMRGADLEPMIGLWPPAVRELTRPAAQPPVAVTPVETFALAVQMEDMTAVLSAIVSAPVRLRAQDKSVFARTQAEIEQRMVALPEWCKPFFPPRRSSRVDAAALELEIHRYVHLISQGGNPHLEATSAGVQWLARTPKERLTALMNPARKSKEVNPPGAYHGELSRFFPYSLPYFEPPKGIDLRTALTTAFLGAVGQFLPLGPFLDYHAREANPFLALPSPSPAEARRHVYAGGGDVRETYPILWQNALHLFLAIRLIGLGGAVAGRLPDGTLCFSVTDAGRYLFGAADDFAYGSSESVDVVVQPNFDIVFLGSAPTLEAEIARFAQRVGATPGLAFRLTRASVLAAAQAGATAGDVIGALVGASSKALPKNVEREIAGWMASVRRARIRAAELIECDDDASGAKIAEVMGSRVQRLSPTVFELPAGTPAARSASLKRLRAAGVILAETADRSAPKARRGRANSRTVEAFDDEDDDEDEEY